MIEKLQQLKQFIYDRLPARWGVKSKVQQITSTVTHFYEFNLQINNPEHVELNWIRQNIILFPYVVPTRPIQIKTIQSKNETTDLSISFTVLNMDQGKKIEELIRSRFHQTKSGD